LKHSFPLEFKDADPADPVELVTKSLDDLTKSVDDRLKAIETKADTTKLVERMDRIEAKQNRPSGGDNKDEQAKLETKAFGAYLRNGNQADPLELKTLIVSSDPQGGYLAPTEMATEFIRDLVQYSPIRGLASVRSTSSPAVSYPKRVGRTNAKWKGETQEQETGEPTFGQLEIPVREINTYVDISNQLLADSAGAAESEVRMALAEDFGLKEGLSFLKGAGPLQPEGLLVNADIASVATGNASTLGSNPADMLIDVFYSLPAAYRNQGTWLMNSTTLAAIRKLKDGTTGTYLWSPGFQGQADTILGRPVVDCPDMDSVGSGTTPIAFGDIKTTYRILDRIGLSILVNPYIQATNGITRIHATRRVGGAVVQPAAMKKIVCKTS
jgi:HK97 family phage major capsid protein